MGVLGCVRCVGGGDAGLAGGVACGLAGRPVCGRAPSTGGGGSSQGSCGTITPGHAMALPAPGTIGRALRLMLTPDAPLYIKPRFDPALTAWLLQFASRCNRSDWLKAAVGKAAILEASRLALPEWIARHRWYFEFVAFGPCHVFRTLAALAEFDTYLPAIAALGSTS